MFRFKSERGVVLVLVAVGMTAFLGMLGLVIDVGQIFMERVRLARAVDAAVIAGVQELPLQPKAALISAYEYALANSLTPEDLQVGISEQNHIISACAQKQVSLSFLSLFGFKQLQVSAEAAAMIGPVVGCTGVIPVGVPWDDFEFGQVYELKIDAHSGRKYQGNFGALALGGTGANTYRNNLKYGYQGMLRVGDQVYTEPGNMAGPTRQGIEYRLKQAPSIPGQPWYENTARIAIVPIVDSIDVSGRALVTIVGFAAFYLEGVEAQGNRATIRGRFVEHLIDGEIGSGPNYGLLAYRLIQ